MIRALVFDFDGLILDTETPALLAWEALHREAGLEFRRDDATRIVGHIDVPFDPWHAFGDGADRVRLNQEHKRRARALLEMQTVLPGVAETLREAKNRGLHLAIASNSSHGWVERHLQRLELLSCFDLVKCREDVPLGKPEPDLYSAVLQYFGLSGAEAIAFEDSEPGSLAAKRAGLWVVAVPNPSTHQHGFGHVDLQLSSLADFPLEELLRRFSS